MKCRRFLFFFLLLVALSLIACKRNHSKKGAHTYDRGAILVQSQMFPLKTLQIDSDIGLHKIHLSQAILHDFPVL